VRIVSFFNSLFISNCFGFVLFVFCVNIISYLIGAIAAPQALTMGPMSSHFENENSYSAFLGSPFAEIGVVGGGEKLIDGTETKRILFGNKDKNH
jgi:hypothetical protein